MKSNSGGYDAGGMEKSKAGNGQTIVRPFGRDNSSYGVDSPRMSAKMGGSTTNLSHSLSGTSANMKGTSGK